MKLIGKILILSFVVVLVVKLISTLIGGFGGGGHDVVFQPQQQNQGPLTVQGQAKKFAKTVPVKEGPPLIEPLTLEEGEVLRRGAVMEVWNSEDTSDIPVTKKIWKQSLDRFNVFKAVKFARIGTVTWRVTYYIKIKKDGEYLLVFKEDVFDVGAFLTSIEMQGTELLTIEDYISGSTRRDIETFQDQVAVTLKEGIYEISITTVQNTKNADQARRCYITPRLYLARAGEELKLIAPREMYHIQQKGGDKEKEKAKNKEAPGEGAGKEVVSEKGSKDKAR